jgi:UDP-N-acetylglucosamine--N-acetylmuramyl-(pentapeptide) pyrophosphoryl-undecaprenol N-acetylglucosamine transferase
MTARQVLIAAGGTGGHMFPAAAFATEMAARGWGVTLMTDARGRLYAKDFPADRVEDVPAATFSGMNPVRALSAGVKIARGIAAAQGRLRALDPALVAGFGGYPSLPALWAARAQKRPILIHEQNAVLGRVNRSFAKDAAAIACGFARLDLLPPGTEGRKHVTGNPVRGPILAAREAGFPPLPAGAPMRLLIIGGSQGARLFGQVIPEALALLPADLRARLEVTQQVRAEQVDTVRAAYQAAEIKAEIAPFFTDMGPRLAACHFVIARAGASSVTELMVAGRGAVLVPLKIAADDHQTANAAALAAVGAADIIEEDMFVPAVLAPLLRDRLGDGHSLAVRAAAARAAGQPDSAQRLADLAEQTAAR